MKRMKALFACMAISLTACGNVDTAAEPEHTKITELIETVSKQEIVPESFAKEDLFYVETMNDQQRQYCNKYLSPLLGSGLLISNWSIQDYSALEVAAGVASPAKMTVVFQNLVGQEHMCELKEAYGLEIPSDEVEEVLIDYFPFSESQLQEIMRSEFDLQSDSYHIETIRSAMPVACAVTGLEEDAEYLYLSYAVYAGFSGLDASQDSYFYRTTGKLTLKKESGGMRYWAAQVQDKEESQILQEIDPRSAK